MIPMNSDFALFFKKYDETLHGLSATYVGDLLRAGTSKFREKCKTTNNKLDIADDIYIPMEITSFKI